MRILLDETLRRRKKGGGKGKKCLKKGIELP
jgi:hypothetical protein